MTTHWLRNGPSSISFAAFTENGENVSVLALIGATQYIDRTMTKEEARNQWKEMTNTGWHHVSDDELKEAKMNTQRLKLFIYD